MNTNKRFYVICEEAFAESIWCKQLLGGLLKEFKKRRNSYEQIFCAQSLDGQASVCIIGFTDEWTGETVKKCNDRGCVPVVLSSQSKRSLSGHYHLICPDIQRAAEKLQEALAASGRTKIALYAANRELDLDRDRTEVFAPLAEDVSNIYSNKDQLENCFRSFLPKSALYDAVICVNGYAAVSLVKRMEKENPELLQKLVIVTFEEVLKHSKYNQWISRIDFHLEAYGAVAMMLLDIADQSSATAEITVKMQCSVCEIPEKILEREATDTQSYFEDPEIIYMARIEQLLRDADDMDHHIIAMMLDGATYADIADSCYMTEGNIKYRVKKYLNICDCKTKKELLELLREYLQ